MEQIHTICRTPLDLVVENTGFNRRCPKFRKADKVLGLEQLVSELQVLDGLLGVAGIVRQWIILRSFPIVPYLRFAQVS